MVASSPRSNPTSSPGTQATPEEVAAAAEQARTEIEAAQQNDDVISEPESGYSSDDGGSVTTSVSSSVRDYNFENGRRYHKYCEGRYVFPNDEQEQDREDMKHAMTVAVCGDKLHFAPIGENPSRILDLGTGTGIWCVDMGDAYPMAEVIGVDLSPIQPTFVPPNVRFLVDDIESDWIYSTPFDLIHLRAMAPAIRNWPRVLGSAYEWLKPGAYIELQELDFFPRSDDGSMPPDWALKQYTNAVREGLKNFGIEYNVAHNVAQKLRDAGFVNVVEQTIKVPLGAWAKNPLLRTAGLYMQAAVIDAFGMALNGPLQKGLGWSREESEVFIASARKAIRNPRVHAYFTLYMVYGQRPFTF
ncbi:putative methyltransferase domain-containing protein [Botryosphaeria dothidea]|uniref:Methyltransferase domain-containing protein n=1 Tax=Botryosphaeria dothidea TaxID=55169 RepID=A0A8H4NAX2_9PEZI|nr:putative methyltransferase domain-containing protein [Botryosphaeria dothidea]